MYCYVVDVVLGDFCLLNLLVEININLSGYFIIEIIKYVELLMKRGCLSEIYLKKFG